MKILIIGANGQNKDTSCNAAQRTFSLTAIVRTDENLPQSTRNHEDLPITTSTILDMNHKNVMQHIENYDVIVSCLGDRLDFRGLFEHPS
jgi:putative NADH-flavin reductase